MRYLKFILPVILFSACTEAIEFTERDKAALEGLEIAYQGATEAISELEDAIHDGADEEEIQLIDAQFHEHYENYLIYSEEYSHTFLTDHIHDSDHGMQTKKEDGDDDDHDGGSDEAAGHDGGGDDSGNDEPAGHDEGDDAVIDPDSHHKRGEHHAEDHEDMEHLMEEHDEMDIQH